MEKLILTQIPVTELRQIVREEISIAIKNHLSQIGQTDNQTDEYLNIEQLSELIKRSIPSIRGLVYRRKIPVMKIGKKLMFERKAIDEWLQRAVRKTKEEIEQNAISYLFDSNLKNGH